MHTASVGVIGASGYSGIEATRILAAHPAVELAFATSDRWQGQSIASRTAISGKTGQLEYVGVEKGLELARGCAVVLLCTPAETSLELAPKLLEAGTRVIDLSGAFRLTDAGLYKAYYGFEHREPKLLGEAVYGLVELRRERIARAKLLANPGCYATAAAMTAAPLLRSGLLEDGSLIIDAASGVTGAGRQAAEGFSFTEVNEDFKAYKVLRHQHTPEIHQTIAAVAGRQVPLTFTPHLLPIRRGILTTLYARLKKGATPEALIEASRAFYRDEKFVGFLESPDAVTLKGVVGTNRLAWSVGAEARGFDPGRVVAVSALDNLVKGAAGQAVQNMNLMLGLDEGLGLETLRGFFP